MAARLTSGGAVKERQRPGGATALGGGGRTGAAAALHGEGTDRIRRGTGRGRRGEAPPARNREGMHRNGANRGRQRAELLAGSNGGRAAPARFRPGERGSELEEAGGGGGRGEGAVGARNRGTAAGVRRRGDGGELCSSSRRRKMGRRRRTRQRGRIRPATAARIGTRARRTRITCTWREDGRRWRRAEQREGGKGRLTSGPGEGFLFILFFFLGCDS